MERAPDTPLLAFERLDVDYGAAPALRGVDLALEEGEALGIVGESGSGKSTLLKAAMGLLGPRGRVAGGRVLLRGRNLAEMSAAELRGLRGSQIAMVWQDCLAHLTPTIRVGDQLYESVAAHEERTRAEVDARACRLLASLNVAEPERILASRPFELSGGLGQRVGVAMAMITRPALLLADEPTSALDTVSQKQVAEELAALCREEGTALLLVSHNVAVVRALAGRVAVMREGRIVEQGPTEQVLAHPRHAYTRELVEAVPRLPWEEMEAER